MAEENQDLEAAKHESDGCLDAAEERIAELEQENVELRSKLVQSSATLASIWLYVPWRYVTQQLTTNKE